MLEVRIVRFPETRVAVAEHRGPPAHEYETSKKLYLYREWLPASGEQVGSFPIFFRYVNVGPNIQEDEMITDVYLPLK